jgi:hypothetical protein
MQHPSRRRIKVSHSRADHQRRPRRPTTNSCQRPPRVLRAARFTNAGRRAQDIWLSVPRCGGLVIRYSSTRGNRDGPMCDIKPTFAPYAATLRSSTYRMPRSAITMSNGSSSSHEFLRLRRRCLLSVDPGCASGHPCNACVAPLCLDTLTGLERAYHQDSAMQKNSPRFAISSSVRMKSLQRSAVASFRSDARRTARSIWNPCRRKSASMRSTCGSHRISFIPSLRNQAVSHRPTAPCAEESQKLFNTVRVVSWSGCARTIVPKSGSIATTL